MKNFTVTEKAFERIAAIAGGSYLRVAVEGGGCTGYKYDYAFDSNINSDDMVFSSGNSGVVVDEVSLKFLEEAVLDYKDDLGSAGFEIKNPNTTARCGCGNSFSI